MAEVQDGLVSHVRRPRSVVVVVLAGATLLVAGAATALLRDAPDVTGRAAAVELTDFEGERFTLGGYEGTPLVVNFWASWCPSCTAEMPAFERVYQRLDQRVEFLGINYKDSRDAAEKLARATGVTYRLAEDQRGEAFAAFGGIGMPTTVFIDEAGDVVEVVAGGLSEEQLASLIEEHFGVSA